MQMKIQTYNLPLMQFFGLVAKRAKMLPSFEKGALGDDLFEV